MDQKRGDNNKTEARSAYSDAYYREAPDERRSCYGYSPAQCYARAAAEENAAPPDRKPKKKRPISGASLALVSAIVLLTVSLLFSGNLFLNYHASAAVDEPDTSRELYEEYSAAAILGEDDALPLCQHSVADGTELSAEDIYTRACRSTVGVTTPGYAYNIFGQAASRAVTGTGIVLSEDGYILTNFHVIETAYDNGTPIHILMYDGDEYEAEVVGIESDSDLAVLKIEAEGLTAATLGDSDEIRVGQTIYTVGNPLGELTYTMTSGIISALGRRITTDEAVIVNMFQVDAAINNGNSGGPVFNVCGQVIGVVTAKYTQYGMEGLGFAIPINDACRIADDLVEKGYVTGKAYLGMSFANVSPSVARYYDMVQGVYISVVEAGSCSETAGLQPGDIITAIDGVPVATTNELVDAVRAYRAGDSAEFTVWRSKQTLSVTVVFDEELPAERVETEANVGRPSFEPDMRES